MQRIAANVEELVGIKAEKRERAFPGAGFNLGASTADEMKGVARWICAS
jgi:hypothetical protein